MWGAQEKSEGAHQKNFGIVPPHFQIASDATARSPGGLTPLQKMSHIFEIGRPTKFNLGTRMEYDDPLTRIR